MFPSRNTPMKAGQAFARYLPKGFVSLQLGKYDTMSKLVR
jgi:hypothetical protein